jgi:hypothetical protein
VLGSAQRKKFWAKLAVMQESFSMGFSCKILYNSMQIAPTTRAVVVAIAGMIFPAIPRDLCKLASPIL